MYFHRIGGIVPMVVQDLHAMCIKDVVDGSLANSNLTIHDVNAIAVTVKPGWFIYKHSTRFYVAFRIIICIYIYIWNWW